MNLSSTVEPQHVKEALELVKDPDAPVDMAKYDLQPEEPEPEGVEEEEEQVEPAAKRPKQKLTLQYAEYERIAKAATLYLELQEELHIPTTEEDLIAWYTGDQMQKHPDMDEEDMLEQQRLIQAVIKRLVDVDKVIIEVNPSDDASFPERRVIRKHPNFNPSTRAAREQRAVAEPFAQHARAVERADDALPEP